MATTLITGAPGIGQAIYDHFKLNPKSRYKTVNDKIIGVSLEGPDVYANLANFGGCADRIRDSVSDLTPVSLLINCAGVYNDDDAGSVMDTNFWAPYYLMDLFIDHLLITDGLVINVASTAAHMAEPDNPLYAASKAALVSLTKSYAAKFAPDIRFVSISPGLFRTEMFKEPADRRRLKKVPMGFEATPIDIIPTIECIMRSRYMTGNDIIIDGGMTCQIA